MNSSDWLAIALTLVGILSGSGIAWVFFREQQRLSFDAFDKRLSDIASGIATLRENANLASHIDVARELGAVRASIESIDLTVANLVHNIVDEVRKQQTELLRVVQAQFERQVSDARKVIRNSVAKELGTLPPAVEAKLLDLISDALLKMGQFQLAAIEKHSQDALERVEEQVSGAIGKVGDEVHDLREKLSALDPSFALALGSGEGNDEAV